MVALKTIGCETVKQNKRNNAKLGGDATKPNSKYFPNPEGGMDFSDNRHGI